MNLSEHRRLPELCILVRLQVETNLWMKKLLLNTQCKFRCSKQDFPLLIWPLLNDFVSCSITHQHRILLWNCFQENCCRIFSNHDKERPSLNLQLCYSPMLLTQFVQCLDFESAFFVPLFSYLIFATLFKPHFCHPVLPNFATLFLPHSKSPGTSPCHLERPVHTSKFRYKFIWVHTRARESWLRLVHIGESWYGIILRQEKVQHTARKIYVDGGICGQDWESWY